MSVRVPICKYFLVIEAEKKHVGRRASLVAVDCFLPGRAKDLSAPLYKHTAVVTKFSSVEYVEVLVVQISA